MLGEIFISTKNGLTKHRLSSPLNCLFLLLLVLATSTLSSCGGSSGGGGSTSNDATNSPGSLSVVGTWGMYVRCVGRNDQLSETASVTIANVSSNSFSANGHVNDYGGIPLDWTLNGTYNSSSNMVTGTLIFKDTIADCVRTDTFDGSFATGDTDYINTSHSMAGSACGRGCDNQIRFLKKS